MNTQAAAMTLVRNAAADSNIFRKEGDYWTIVYGGAACWLKDAKGLHYLAQLLRQPGQDFHATELVAAVAEPRAVCELGQRCSLGDAGEVLDAAAIAAYKRRLADLRAELQEAEAWNDSGRLTMLRQEFEFLTNELAAAVGLSGRHRKAGAHAERARLHVTQRIKATLTRLRSYHPSLGHHLATCVKTGYFCSYLPDPKQPVFWVCSDEQQWGIRPIPDEERLDLSRGQRG